MEKKYAYTLEDVKEVEARDLFFGTYTKKEQKIDSLDNLVKGESDPFLASVADDMLKEGRLEELIRRGKIDKKEATNLLGNLLGLFGEAITMDVITLMKDGKYINIQDNSFIDPNEWQLAECEPFSGYYKDGEFRFLEVDGRACLDVDSLDPFNEYTAKKEAERKKPGEVTYSKTMKMPNEK